MPRKKPTDRAVVGADPGTLAEIKGATELAMLLGFSVPRLLQLVDEGVIEKESHGKYDIYKVIPAYCNHVRRSKVATSAKGSMDDSQRRKAKAQADMAERESDLQAGTLIPADLVQKRWTGILHKVRQQLLALPTKVAPLVSVETETEACREIVSSQVDGVLQELSGDNSPDESDAPADSPSGAGGDGPGTDGGDEDFDAATETDGEPVGGPLSPAELGSIG